MSDENEPGNEQGTAWDLRPARDLDLPFKERMRSVRRDPSVFSSTTRWAWWTAVGAVMRVWHRFRIVGAERLPPAPPFVLVANHSSHLDVVSLMLSVPPKWRDRVFPLAAADHFFGEVPLATFTALALNALPMPRQGGGQGRETMLYLRDRLREEGCGVVVFPEGTRSRTGELGRFRSGVGLLVAGTDIPVVPCWIEGAYAAFPAVAKFPRPRPVSVVIGEPLTFAGLAPDQSGCETVAKDVERAVRALMPKR
jgi:1-acyl-sn-glycerol-3-phosphate acyltransferase